MQQSQQPQTLSVTGAEMQQETEIDLLELGYEILDKLKYIIAAAVLGIILAGVYVFAIAVPTYEAVAKLYVLNSNDSVVNLSDLQLGNYLASDYTELFQTWEVKEMVRTNLGLDYSYEELESMVKVDNPADTRILYITVTSTNPQEARAMANEYASVVSDYVSKIMAAERPNLLSEAIVPDSPVSPKKAQTLIIGMLLGLALSMGVVILRFIMDDSIKSVDDVEKHLGLPVFAIVPMTHQQAAFTKSRGGKR